MRKLSELLEELARMEAEWNEYYYDEELDELEKDMLLTDLSGGMDCIAAMLMYGDYINDTGEPFDYYEF